MRRLLVVPACAVVPALLAAQTPAEIAAAAATITAQEVANHIQIIADDSMKGRDTPSPGLEATARYVAAQFQALGLRTAAGNGTWFQRYQIPPQIDLARSQVVFTGADGKQAAAGFTTAARLADQTVPEHGAPAGAVLIAGQQTPQSLDQVNLNNKVVLYVPPRNADPATERRRLEQLRESSRGVVIVSDLDSVDFAERVRSSLQQSDVRLGMSWSAQVRPAAVPGLSAMLTANGVDLKQARAETKPVIQNLPSLQVALNPVLIRSANDSATAPNVVAVLEGGDPKLKNEYVLFAAHMDHTGIRHGQADSIANGADDNASGTAGLIALAKAFSQPGARPARSLVFLATSGGAKNFWGSREFVNRLDVFSSPSSFGLQIVISSGPSQRISIGGGGGARGGAQFSFGNADPTPPPAAGSDSADKNKSNSSANAGVAPMPIPDNGQVIMLGGDPAPGKGSGNGQGASDVEITRVVAVINLDMIGRHAGDSIMIDGVSDVEVPTPPAWLAAAHPELQLMVVDGGTAAKTESDHFPFIRLAVPSLYFHNGWHGTTAAAESVKTIDADLAARIVRLVFYVGQDIGNGQRPPHWNAEGRRHYLEVLEQ